MEPKGAQLSQPETLSEPRRSILMPGIDRLAVASARTIGLQPGKPGFRATEQAGLRFGLAANPDCSSAAYGRNYRLAAVLLVSGGGSRGRLSLTGGGGVLPVERSEDLLLLPPGPHVAAHVANPVEAALLRGRRRRRRGPRRLRVRLLCVLSAAACHFGRMQRSLTQRPARMELARPRGLVEGRAREERRRQFLLFVS